MSEKVEQPDIHITVKVFGGLREAFEGGTQIIELSPQSTLGDLMAALRRLVPELSGKLQDGLQAGYLTTLLNGRNTYFLQGLDTPLNDTDTVAFLPPVGGG